MWKWKLRPNEKVLHAHHTGKTFKMAELTKCSWGWLPCIAGRYVNSYHHYVTLWLNLVKLKLCLTHDPYTSFPGYRSESHSCTLHQDKHTRALIAAFIIVAPSFWKEPQGPSINTRMDKSWYIHIMGYYITTNVNKYRNVP